MVTPQLLNYITGQRAAGVSDDTIRTTLVARGWTAEDIQAAFSSLQPAARPTTGAPGPMERMRAVIKTRLFLIIVIAVVVIVVSTAIVLLLKGSQGSTQQSQPEFVNTKTEVKNGLLTYTSQTGDFSIQYPQDWPLIKTPPACDSCTERLIFSPTIGLLDNGYVSDEANILVRVSKTDKDVNFYHNDQDLQADKGVSNIEHLSIGGEPAVSYTINEPNVLKRYWVLHKQVSYMFIVYKGPLYRSNAKDYTDKINAMILSIQFTK